MRLWTVQPLSTLKQIEETGYYRCKEELSYNLSKSNSLKDNYQWLISKMEDKIGTKPSSVDYPIWAWHTWDFQRVCPEVDSGAFLLRDEDKVLLTLDIDASRVVLTDFDLWQIVMNKGYVAITTDQDELDKIEDLLSSLDQEQMLKEIEKSWDNVFDVEKVDTADFQKGKYIQATFWEIRREDVVDAKVLPANK